MQLLQFFTDICLTYLLMYDELSRLTVLLPFLNFCVTIFLLYHGDSICKNNVNYNTEQIIPGRTAQSSH